MARSDAAVRVVEQPVFIARDKCISCGSERLREVAGGSFSEEPLRSFIAADPWGESPLPVLEGHRWSLVECECGQRFHRNILSSHWNDIRFFKWMSAEAIEQFEAEHGGSRDAARDVQHVLRLQALGVRSVLDFGCGYGEFLEMCRLFGLEAHGVDRSYARRSGAGIVVHAKIDDVRGAFDAITMFEVLEHLDDPLGIVRALRARLNPGGVMIVEVPDASGVDGIVDRESYHKVHPLDHINAFTPETLVTLMGRAGFKPLWKAPVFATTSLRRVAKDIAKAALKHQSTQRYFISSGR